MARKCVTFYPTQVVYDWLLEQQNGDKSSKINGAIEASLKEPKAKFMVPLNFYQMKEILAVLEGAKHPLHEYFEQFVL